MIAYLINQYPKVSHSFVRREILALEALGTEIRRFSVRASTDLQDAEDLAENERTTVLLNSHVRVVAAAIAMALRHPVSFIRATRKALALGFRSERGRIVNLAYLAEACLLWRELKRAGITHVHAHFGTNSTAVAMLCQHLGDISYSFTVHGPEEFDQPRSLSLGEKIAHARFVVAISEFGRSQLYRWASLEDWSKIQIVHCGLDSQFLDAPASQPPTAPRLVCVGRLCEQKGQLLLVEAAARLIEEGVTLKLVLVGDGEMRADVEELIGRYQLQDSVEITGWADGESVKQAVLDSRALVLPSFAEGLPVVIMEAMALGRPVISTYVAGIPELVVPAETGWLCAAGSLEQLVSAMREALSLTPERLDAMGQAARKRVALRHDVETEAAKLAGLFAARAESD